MAVYSIEFAHSAYRSFAKLDPLTRQRIAARIDELTVDPRPLNSKRLVNSEELYRIRIGSYRVIYAVEDAVLVVLVVKIGHRRDVYRQL
ncbi:MAG: type II toxin-antitoxin system mRNA interferase toxin, RelE/StbE family [Actinobacteria bacterium HGW-Actinobacteria-7]|jgi:mRNA interferase RelE/StbE|nr:MAG: type II toxin-antitoxin system mRNA interferase toxin, RelE/StbE family [Actinobacteria bacterium HGW-Actinobacteria-7]